MFLAAVLCLLLPVSGPQDGNRETAAAAVLDDWHAAAAAADEARYFRHFTPDAVFLGTDAAERWSLEEFRRYAHPYFAKGKAWSFKAVERHVSFSPDRSVAWFDERLETPNLGPARGSGVLLNVEGAWKIVHYDLSVPIPNALMKEFKRRIEEQGNARPPLLANKCLEIRCHPEERSDEGSAPERPARNAVIRSC